MIKSSLFLILVALSLKLPAQLPDDLIRERSAVVVGLQFQSAGVLTEADWLMSIQRIHTQFRTMGVDAVTYVPAATWSSNADIRELMEKQFLERKVAYLINLGQAGSLFTLSIRPMKENSSIWDTSGSSVDELLLQLGKAIKSEELQLGNFLITESPEVFNTIPTQNRKGFTSMPVKLPAIRIGVPQFAVAQQNEQLQEIMTNYPYAYELFEYTTHEDAFRKGYSFILIRVSATGQAIQRSLDYPRRAEETAYISHTTKGITPIPKEALVHKYYLQHTVSKKIYVGEEWDADTSWSSALSNFIQSVKEQTEPVSSGN